MQRYRMVLLSGVSLGSSVGCMTQVLAEFSFVHIVHQPSCTADTEAHHVRCQLWDLCAVTHSDNDHWLCFQTDCRHAQLPAAPAQCLAMAAHTHKAAPHLLCVCGRYRLELKVLAYSTHNSRRDWRCLVVVACVHNTPRPCLA